MLLTHHYPNASAIDLLRSNTPFQLFSPPRGEFGFIGMMISKFVIKAVDFAVFTILLDPDQDFTFSVSYLPAWSFGINVSRAFIVNIFGTVH